MNFSAIYQEYQPRILRYLAHFSGEADAAIECQCSFYHDERSKLMCDRKA